MDQSKASPVSQPLPEFNEAKRRLDEINAVISGYDPILKEHARDILIRSQFGWEVQGNERTGNHHKDSKESEFATKTRALTLKDYSEKWLPRTGYDRALLALYYIRQTFGWKSATGRQICKELDQNGMHIANISVAMNENVRLLRAQSKVISGTKGTRQSRNDYAITDFGIQYVESRFNLDYRV